jgi:hypothetical protein
MKQKIKTAIVLASNMMYGYFVFLFLPLLFSIATNTVKAAGNNPDGEMFRPVGWAMLLAVPIVFICVNRFIVKKNLYSNKFYLWIAIAFSLGAVVGILVTNANYAINYKNIIAYLLQ